MWTRSYTGSCIAAMSDRYQGFTSSPIGKLLVKNLGLPNPTKLERYTAGAPLVDGTVVVGGTGRLAESLPGLLDVARHRVARREFAAGPVATRGWSSTRPASRTPPSCTRCATSSPPSCAASRPARASS